MSEAANIERLERWRGKLMRALRAGDADATLRAAKRVISLDPDDADAHFFAGLCELEKGIPHDAITRLERATELAPARPDYRAQLAYCLIELDRRREAQEAAEAATLFSPADAATSNTLGKVWARLGRHTDALGHLEAAVEQMPDNLEYQYELAQTLIYLGELERARAVCEAVLERNPHHARTHLALADLLDGPPPDGRIEQLKGALQRATGHIDAELVFSHALARTLEAAGRTSEAFALWEGSKAKKKRALGYTIDRDKTIYSAFREAFDAKAMADPRPGDPSRAPIFVVGMPRTGTTLVERILSSHSAVASGGEMTHLPLSVSAAWSGHGAALVDAEALAAALTADPAEIGARYLASARLQLGETERFVDKLPLNFFFLGFIRRSLPNAKIVCLHRGALDSCLANFRQLFVLQYPQFHYSLSLRDIAEYFVLFEQLIAHWEQLFPGVMCSISYEKLVAEPEREIGRLLDHLELEFEPQVLRFEANQAPVATASAVQVRRPLYTEAVGSWRRYERELEPLRQHLTELGVAV